MAGVSPYTSSFDLAETCVFGKQSLGPFLCDLVSQAPLIPKLRGQLPATMPDEDMIVKAIWENIAYDISATTTKVGFDSVKVGYTQPEAQTITITNDGNVPVTLTAPTSENYAISLDKTTLAVGGTAILTIQPEEGKKKRAAAVKRILLL